ncbi:MAG: tetratricopeptide repeat protein, partial [Magnetococcales bacterium]|nr:tetratricopeptide repeat protein [Magnetococcales bacterium]
PGGDPAAAMADAARLGQAMLSGAGGSQPGSGAAQAGGVPGSASLGQAMGGGQPVQSQVADADAARLEKLMNDMAGADTQQGVNPKVAREGKSTGASSEGGHLAGRRGEAGAGKGGGGAPAAKVDAADVSSEGMAQANAVADQIRKRTVETAHAVSKVRKALADGSSGEVDSGLSKLAAMKGENNPYVMKMQAYVYMREGKYLQAGSLLEDVLKKRKNDLDAAKNMVIVEMKTEQQSSARDRLKDLMRRYPGDRQLRELHQHLN